MAKFKVQDPTELENLIQAVPQSKTPQYTSSVAKPGEKPLGKYDQGVTMFTTPEARRELNYQNQTGWQAWGNAVGQSLAEVTAGTLEGFGYLLDLEQHVKALAGTEKEFDNWFSESMRQFKESVREEMPVFTDPDKPFDPLNSTWWASNLPSIVSTLTLMVPTGAAVGVASKVGRGLGKAIGTGTKVGKFLSADTKMLGGLTSTRALGSGMISRVLESTMEAAGNADQVYKELIAQGKSEEEARTEAGKVASNTYYANLPLMLSDMFEYSVLFRNRGVDNAVEALNKQTKKSLLKNSLAVGGSFLSEGLEEGYQYGVGQEAKRSKNASETMGNVVSNFGEYFEDPEFLSSVVVGGMSGAGFQALGNVIESRSAKLANVFPEFNGEALNQLAVSTGQSISNLKVAGQAAYNKFKGNLQEALSNTEEAVKSLPEGQREIFKLGLDTLKQAGNFVDGKLQQFEPEKVSDSMWNGVKNKLVEGLNRLKKIAGFNEKIQQAEASGDKVTVEILSREQFHELIKESPDRAESFLQQAKEDKVIDPRLVQDYEELFDTYKKSIVEYKGNQDAADSALQAEIRRQAIVSLQEEIYTEGAKYKDFDFAQIREQYLDNIGTPEAKSLKANIEINKNANKSVRKSLKNLIEHLVQLEIEEAKLSKQADKLDTKAGQEELQAKRKQEKLDEIKKSSDPNVLFEAYQGEDEDMSKLAKSRIDKLIKEEFDVLPDPNIFDSVDKFKEFITTDVFPTLGLTKVAPAIDAALSNFYYTNRAEDKPIEETFEDLEFEKVGKGLIQESEDVEEVPEFDSELPNYNDLNDTIQENLQQGDFMLHSQIYSMRKGESGLWWDRKFNKDESGNNKRNRDQYLNWTEDIQATEDLFNNFGDWEKAVYFEVTKPDKVKHGFDTTTIDNHWIRVYVIESGKKIYIGQLQRTSKTETNELTDTKRLADLRALADQELKTLKPGESKTIGRSRIVSYNKGLYNNLAKPRDVRAALTQEELDNISIGVYMGDHEELGKMRTNNPLVRDIKPLNAKPGSVYVAKKTPTGDWQWFACITKKLGEMPELIDRVKELLSPLESTDPIMMERIKTGDIIRNILSQLRSIVRYKVNGKLEPDFNSKIVNVKAYHVNGKFNIDKFIEVHNLFDRPVQIDPKRLDDTDYVRDVVLGRLITDIDRIPFVNPFITVAPPDSNVIQETAPVVETVSEPKVAIKRSKPRSQFLRTDQKPTLYQGQIDIEKAVRELKRIVPNGYTVNVLKDLIQSEGISAYGMVHDAAITLSEKAPYGTEYHEAWHAIEQVLPKFQYDRIKNYLTEEDRADAFADYMMTNQAPSLLKRIFQLIKAFIQDLINYHPSLIDLFDRANAGYYKNQFPKRHGLFYKVDGMTERNKHDFVNVYLAEVGEHFDFSKKEIIENLIDPDPTKNNLTLVRAEQKFDENGEEYFDNSPIVNFFLDVKDAKGLDEANKLVKYIREDLVMDENGYLTSTGTPKFGVLYPELLKALGKRGYKIVLGKTELNQSKLTQERQLEDGEAFEEAENNTLEGWQESASLRSPIEKLSKRMKQLIYSVRSDREDSLGLGMNLTYNGYDAYARLASVIVDSIDVDDMISRIEAKGNSDKFFESFNKYIKEKFSHRVDNIYTELYKALGDKTQPQFWVTQEFVDPKKQVPGEPDFVEIRVFEANRVSIKQRTKNILGDYKGTDPVEFKKLLDIEDVFISHSNLKSALALEDPKKRFLEVWKLVKDKVYSKFINSHLNVEGKKQYEIINGGFFSKLTQRLQRDFDNLKTELYSKDPMLGNLPILQSKPKAGDFQFIINAGYKDKDGDGLMYNNFTEKEFVTSTFNLWLKENLHTMPILSDSPNLIGIKYKVPEGDREEMIAKIIHLEHSRSSNTYGIKNYNPETFIFNEIPYKENFNEQVLEVTKYFDKAVEEYKAYVKEVGALVQFSSNDRPNLVREYLLEHAVVHSQMSMLTVGHLSFYKNLEDYYKRAKEIWSPVIKGNVNNVFYRKDTEGNVIDKIDVISKWQNVNVLPTVESPSSQAKELESIGFNDYKKVDKTDAQTYIDLIAYRDRMITLNEWTEEHQVAYDQLEKGIIPQDLKPGLFNVIKPFYFNLHVVDGELVSPVQKKDSELLILPVYGLETINGQENPLYNPLWKKHLEMMGYNFETMSYDYKGRRDGKYFDVITYDTTIKVGKRDTLRIDLAKWGKQQETPEHHYMSDAIFGIQIMKLITGNLEGNYNVDGVEMTAKELWTEYNQLVSKWIESNYGKLLKELKAIDTLPLSYLTDSAEEALEMVEKYGSEQVAREAIKKTFTGENDSEKILKRMIIEEMINKGMRDDYIRSVQELPLTHPIHFNKVIQIINSFAKNNITDLKFDHGYTFANASSEGFKNDLKIKWNNGDPKLGIDHFEVYAPIHDPRIKNYLVDGQVDMDALQADINAKIIPDLLSGLVYRIPTEGKYSMFKIKIKGFLPVDNGVIFMPDMVTKIAGLDFDIDKVRGFFLGGNRRQDRILKLMMAVLSSPASLKEQLTPGGFDNLKSNNLLIRAYKAGIDPEGKSDKELEGLLKDKLPFFSPITLSKIAKRMNTGKALIGTAANANAVHSLMEAYNFFEVSSYNDRVEIIYNGESLVEMSRRYDTDGNLISANIAELLAAFVDNGKDPQAEYSNITSDTIGTALYLLKKGVPLKAVQFFMTQVSPEAIYPGTSTGIENFSLSKLELDLKKKDDKEDYDAFFRSLQKGAKQFEQYIAGVKVANAGAGATMVDNYLKIKKYKNALEDQTTVLADSGLTSTLINKGLLEWNDFIVDTFKVPDVNRGTIVESLDLLTQHILERVTDADVKDMYNSFISFVASGYFKYDQTIVNRLNDSETLKKYKLLYPTNKFLNRLEYKDNFLQFAGANTNDELEIQAIIDNWEELLNSEDQATRNFGEALIKYSFYQRGFDFGMGSFGHLIPASYFIKNTEFTKYYTETMKSLDQANQEKANLFVEQYIQNNYLDVKIPIVTKAPINGVIQLDNPPSIGEYIARYIRRGNFIYKHVGGGVYKEMTVRADYVNGNKYLQRYNFNGKVIEFNSEKSEKQFIPQPVENDQVLKELSAIAEREVGKTVIVPEGSSSTNLPIFETEDSIYLMNDQQQAAYNEIFEFVTEKLSDRSSDQSPLSITKLGKGSIPKGVYENSIGLLGKGGTGKTTLIKKVIEDIAKTQRKNYDSIMVRYIAPTHTAATMLQDALGMDSEQVSGVDTFASFVGRNQVKGSNDGIAENADLLLIKDNLWLEGIEKGQFKPVSEADLIIVDESSMISNTMMKNFLQRFNVEGGTRLPIFIFMGDYRQLPPIEETKEKFSEGVISATVFTKPDKFVELTQVMRSKDQELHRVYDSVGSQITVQRQQILNGQEPDKFNWNKYDNATSKSTENILITQERHVDQVIEDYTDQLIEQDNPYHIFWTHYNQLSHQRTKVLFDKIRKIYFNKLGVTKIDDGIMKGDYIQYTQSLPVKTLPGEYEGRPVTRGVLKPGSRYKVKDLIKEAVPLEEINSTLATYFGLVKMNADRVYLINRKNELRYVTLFEKGAIKAGEYNKNTKSIPVTLRTSDGQVITRDVAYKDFFDLKQLVASARKGINGIFEPSYIGSTHTVQGASIKTIIVGDYNIRQNQGSVDMRDIESSLYTALTRSAGKLVIIKPNVIPIENNQEVFSYTQPPVSLPEKQMKGEEITFTQKRVILNNNPSEFANYSGAASGSDQEWEKVGKEFGIGKQVNYTVNSLDKLTPDQMEEVETAYAKAAEDLGRKPLDAGSYSGKLVRRDYLQAKAADSIFAIGTILKPGDRNKKGYEVKSKTESVDGGTGYAVQMGINLGKPVYVFDQSKGQWFSWNGTSFTPTETPTLTPKFAGIGTRELTDSGKTAIREVYSKTFQSEPITFTQELVDTINENVKKAGYNKVYTIEELNSMPEDRKKKAIDCYGTKS